MLRKFFLTILLPCVSLICSFAQSVYMHEAQEDAMEQDGEGLSPGGLFVAMLLFGIIYVIVKVYSLNKENKGRRVLYQKRKVITDSIADRTLETSANLSKYQHKEAWQKGYKKAEYDRMYRTPRKLIGKSIDELVAEYRHTCELGHIVQADKIMEEIGYFQCLEPQKEKITSN